MYTTVVWWYGFFFRICNAFKGWTSQTKLPSYVPTVAVSSSSLCEHTWLIFMAILMSFGEFFFITVDASKEQVANNRIFPLLFNVKKRKACWYCMQSGATFRKGVRLIQPHSLQVCVQARVCFNLISFQPVWRFLVNLIEPKSLRLKTTLCFSCKDGWRMVNRRNLIRTQPNNKTAVSSCIINRKESTQCIYRYIFLRECERWTICTPPVGKDSTVFHN